VLRCRVRHHPPHLDHHNAGRAHVSDHETWQVIPERRRHKVIGRHRQCVGLHHHNLTPRGPCAVYWSGAACRYPNPSFTHLYGTVLPHSVGELPLLLSSDRVTTRAAASKPRGWLRCETHSACCYCWLSVRALARKAARTIPVHVVPRASGSRAAGGGGGAIRATDTPHTPGLCVREGMRVLMRARGVGCRGRELYEGKRRVSVREESQQHRRLHSARHGRQSSVRGHASPAV